MPVQLEKGPQNRPQNRAKSGKSAKTQNLSTAISCVILKSNEFQWVLLKAGAHTHRGMISVGRFAKAPTRTGCNKIKVSDTNVRMRGARGQHAGPPGGGGWGSAGAEFFVFGCAFEQRAAFFFTGRKMVAALRSCAGGEVFGGTSWR